MSATTRRPSFGAPSRAQDARARVFRASKLAPTAPLLVPPDIEDEGGVCLHACPRGSVGVTISPFCSASRSEVWRQGPTTLDSGP